jgi:hypothetical protein
MFVRLVRIVLFIWLRKTRNIRHSEFEFIRKKENFFKTHKIGIITSTTGGMGFLCKCHTIIELINSVWVSTRKYTLWPEIILESAYQNTVHSYCLLLDINKLENVRMMQHFWRFRLTIGTTQTLIIFVTKVKVVNKRKFLTYVKKATTLTKISIICNKIVKKICNPWC